MNLENTVKRILIIDDDDTFRKLFFRALEDTPYQIDMAESGERGLELFNECEYDLIFLDLYMPGINGIEVLREIRKTEKETPVFIISAFHKDYLEALSDLSQEGLKFEIVHKSITIDHISLIAKSALEDSNVLQ